jgi:intracellular septation protein
VTRSPDEWRSLRRGNSAQTQNPAYRLASHFYARCGLKPAPDSIGLKLDAKDAMRSLLDFLPLVFFFGAYKYYDIYVATAVLMACTVMQMLALYALDKRLQTMHKITLALVLIFGSMTLAFHDERFIKWKPTVLYVGMAVALAVSLWRFKKNFLKTMLGKQLALPEFVWHKLTVAWVLYCLFMSATNAYVALYFSTEAWVSFKLWGYAFPLVFFVAQGLYIARHLKHDD